MKHGHKLSAAVPKNAIDVAVAIVWWKLHTFPFDHVRITA